MNAKKVGWRPDAAEFAFVLTAVVAIATTFLSPEERFAPASVAALLGAGALFCVVGVFGFEYCARVRRPALTALYFTFQILLGSVILVICRFSGFITLIFLPLASHAAAILTLRWMVAVNALIVVVFGTLLGILVNLQVALQGAVAMSAGLVFVVVFTQVALREQSAREEVERLAAQLKEANRKLREFAVQAQELAIATERNRLAREIHDSLGHYLTVINVQLEAARAILPGDTERAQDALGKAQSLALEGLADVRRSVAALRASPTENRPLPDAIAALVEDCRAAGLLAELTVNGAPHLLSPPTELALYRAAQEGLTNVRKHALASAVAVTLDYGGEGKVRLTVKDNGVGGNGDDSGGFGLLGVRERAQLLGGQVRTSSAHGEGFVLEVELPG